MNKKSLISLAASAVIAGSIFTGCSWNDDDATTTTSTASVEIQASIVNKVETGGLTFDFGTDTCFNNKTLQTTGTALTFSAADLNSSATAACSHAVTSDFNVTVNPIKAYIAASAGTIGTTKLSTEIGTEPLVGVKGKPVNILSTIAIATNQTVENINVNDAASPGVKALKDMIQTKLAAGTSLATLVPTSAVLNIANFKTEAVGKTTAMTTTGIPAALTTNLGINLAAINAVKEVYKADATKTFTQAAADTTVTTADNSITAFKQAATTAASAAKLAVNGIALKVGSYNYGGTSNNFTVARSNDQTVTNSSDVIISVMAAGENSFGVTSGTLKAKVTKGSNTLTVTLNGVTIATDSNGKVTASIAGGSTVSVVSTYSGIDSVSGTLNSAITSSDLSFSLNTLINAITTNSTGVTTAKNQIIAALSSKGDYTVTVGLSGTMTSGAITNLADVSSALGSGYKGFTGSVSIVGSAAEVAGIAKATADLATANTQATAANTAISSIATASTSAAVDVAVTAAATAKTALDAACDAVTANTYATTTQKATATSIKSTAASAASSVTSMADARKATIVADGAFASLNGSLTVASATLNESVNASNVTVTTKNAGAVGIRVGFTTKSGDPTNSSKTIFIKVGTTTYANISPDDGYNGSTFTIKYNDVVKTGVYSTTADTTVTF